MNNTSFAGDNLILEHGRNPKTRSSIGVSGWFDVKHQCSETGKITDHSGPNCILLDGITGMLAGLTSNTTANASGVVSFKSGILVSSHNGAINRGEAAVIADTSTGTDFASCACSTAADADADTLFPSATSSPVTGVFTDDNDFDGRNGAGALINGGGGIFYTTGPVGNDIFTTAPGTPATFTITSATVVLVADVTSVAAQVVNGIFVVNQGQADIAAESNIKPLAGRTTATGGETSEEFTPAITMNNADTLSITYALSIVVA
tara:strand:- start:355 stop:1143 length:789 start_codon:yes stop_codon:yes gene_type:complete